MASSDSSTTMHVNPQRAAQLIENVARVGERIKAANTAGRNIRLIAVSKLKPASDILALHTSTSAPTTHHFGENYSQELHEKAALLPKTVKWHFIGALQTNKCKPLAEGISNLWCVSSVDTNKKADALQKGRKALRERLGKEGGDEEDVGPLRIMVQVNTSGESEKSGVEPHLAISLCRHVLTNCPDLKLAGLMTIGAIARSVATTPENENEDFVALKRVREEVTKELGWKEEELELSMGMSSDFESAVRLGSDEVRVGTGIFGERPPRKDAKVKEEVEDGKK